MTMMITMVMIIIIISRRRNGASVDNYKHGDDASIIVQN